jgi:phosphoribosylformylglycinamidine cyclo-ligase
LSKPITYKDAGVDIEKKEASFQRIKQKIAATKTPEVITDVGLFGGFFKFPTEQFTEPVLVSSTDGVGTKIKVAFMANKHDTIGQDLVNHCINDVAVCGAKPLFFLDYFACGKLEPAIYEQVLDGITSACKQAGIPLIGGETAEMPDFYQQSEYDLAGTIVGAVDKSRMINGSRIEAGDVLIGVSSSGLHTNGFTLARKVLFPKFKLNDQIEQLGCTLGEELLKVHINYYPLISNAVEQFDIKGIVHVTGGGIVKNSQRLLPENLSVDIDWNSWEVPNIFRLIQETGNVPVADMRQTFNMGIGLIFILPPNEEKKFLKWGYKIGFKLYNIGAIIGT